MVKVFDLFSGGGGFRQGIELAGFKTVAYCEINKWAKKFYNQAFNTQGELYFNDATKINTGELPDFDLLCAGFPCQAFSIAGKRQGFNDTRGTMFFEVARILKDKQPKYFILENVKGLLSHENGRTFQTILKILSDIGIYSIEWALLNSKFFGVPQNRERVFIVGYPRNFGIGQVFPLKISNRNNIKTDDTVESIYWKNSKDKWVREKRTYTGTIKTHSDLTRRPLIIDNVHPSGKGQNGNVYSTESVCPTLTTNKGEGIKIGSLRTAGKKGIRFTAENICPCVPARAREDGSHQPVILQIPRGKNQGGIKEDCPTISSNQFEYNNPLLHQGLIRRLTPLECFRLQGFSDEVFYKGSQGISDAQLYKIAGNSVTVNVVYEIAKRIKELEQHE